MDIDLKPLTSWTRRASGDRANNVRETQIGTGDTAVVLGNSGGISVQAVSIDGTAVFAYVLSGNVLTFDTAPADTSTIIITYTFTKYTDLEVQQFISDAADSLSGDTHIFWTINKTSCKLTVDPTVSPIALTKDQTDLDQRIRELIVYKAAADLYGDKANLAADRAISVKDSDTTIDTSKTAAASEKALKRLQDRYDKALKVFRSESFKGVAGEVFAEEVRTWGNDPLWGNRY